MINNEMQSTEYEHKGVSEANSSEEQNKVLENINGSKSHSGNENDSWGKKK
eukprot:CAMPEP_0170549588 /NCGR_PEP_ID=MMETSP0211-20121228/7734_1 /TAXON_ID=311385 /ORGANISM="Pseudokeronopsis sp., Strain OXSARD2" /LENGTH=50 /DNA_ID=CAMNT_0010855681 /DNA_START=185 /DNA_END=337 /DNA_ORIENTATION=+